MNVHVYIMVVFQGDDSSTLRPALIYDLG